MATHLYPQQCPPLENCGKLEGSAVATNTRLRVAIWDSESGKEHVLRAWVMADNADPRWVTHGVAVTTRSPSELAYDESLSRQFISLPKSGASDTVSGDVLAPGGTTIGADGLVGSCWDNRVFILLSFQAVASD